MPTLAELETAYEAERMKKISAGEPVRSFGQLTQEELIALAVGVPGDAPVPSAPWDTEEETK